MKISCRHGYFRFDELKSGQASHFARITGFDLVSKGDYFTFEKLADAKKYSIAGGLYLGAPAIKTFEGEPWEVMRENGLVYDFTLDLVVPILTVLHRVSIQALTDYFLSNGMILPGSVMEDGSRVRDYAAFYLFDTVKFKYSEVGFE